MSPIPILIASGQSSLGPVVLAVGCVGVLMLLVVHRAAAHFVGWRPVVAPVLTLLAVVIGAAVCWLFGCTPPLRDGGWLTIPLVLIPARAIEWVAAVAYLPSRRQRSRFLHLLWALPLAVAMDFFVQGLYLFAFFEQPGYMRCGSSY